MGILIFIIIVVIITIIIFLIKPKKQNNLNLKDNYFGSLEHKTIGDGNSNFKTNFSKDFNQLKFCGTADVCEEPISLKSSCLFSNNIFLLHNKKEVIKSKKYIWVITDVMAISKEEWENNLETYKLKGWVACGKNQGSIPGVYPEPLNTNDNSNPIVYLCIKYEKVKIKNNNTKVLVSIEARHFSGGYSACLEDEGEENVRTVGDIPENLIAGNSSYFTTCLAIGACVRYVSLKDTKEYIDSIILNYLSDSQPQINRLNVSRDIESSEQLYKGITLKFPEKSGYKNISGSEWKFQTQNQYAPKISFGSIIALAGDLYAIPEEPITPIGFKNNLGDIKKRFVKSFNTLNNNTGDELEKIMNVFKKEEEQVNQYLKEGKLISDFYNNLGHEEDIELNKITGGGNDLIPDYFNNSVLSLAFAGRYLNIAKTNYDHFCEKGHAYYTFLAGHILAMEKAVEAKKTSDYRAKINLMNLAYAYSAFSCHFLTDHYSAGHLRVPREDLAIGRPKGYWSKTAGDYCSKLMHDEDSEIGLVVASNGCYTSSPDPKYCRVWRAYGDCHMFDPQNNQNLKIMQEAVQLSVDEIWKSYETGVVQNSKVHLLLKNIDERNKIPKLDENGKITGYYENNKIEYYSKGIKVQIGEYSSLNHTPLFLSPDLEKIKEYNPKIDVNNYNYIYERDTDGLMTLMSSPVSTALKYQLSSDSYFPGVTHH